MSTTTNGDESIQQRISNQGLINILEGSLTSIEQGGDSHTNRSLMRKNDQIKTLEVLGISGFRDMAIQDGLVGLDSKVTELAPGFGFQSQLIKDKHIRNCKQTKYSQSIVTTPLLVMIQSSYSIKKMQSKLSTTGLSSLDNQYMNLLYQMDKYGISQNQFNPRDLSELLRFFSRPKVRHLESISYDHTYPLVQVAMKKLITFTSGDFTRADAPKFGSFKKV
ncbi:UNKNOWN [Stylonychia lemnae]|uniref:Uncharacterized protein n=1 Tax=Stylonychia lemnae TaxID=5949 RepID=A0A077ZY87_STYLE|nr:UNKNOWN [Stylonychia lemnae]|eukprot:CDW73516.1 UNKNOWN [Stylonychia lemnae]